MSANDSTATRAHAYKPTIIENRLLLRRLAIQIAFFSDEFRRDPRAFAQQFAHDCCTNRKIIISFLVVTIVFSIVLQDPKLRATTGAKALDDGVEDVVMLEPIEPGGQPPRAGFNYGGGSGRDDSRQTQQTGKLPLPSHIVAAIPIKPPVQFQTLPVAGIHIDPALWKDLPPPVYGDTKWTSTIPSGAPGEGEGIEPDRDVGIGVGYGSGFAACRGGNTGCGGMNGCCGGGSEGGGGPGGGGSGTLIYEGDRSAQLMSIPQPEYTEQARQYQVSGTVRLRALLASSGEVVQIRAVNTLPFGLTERAIAAARQIKFVPAMKDGHPVSVFMQLEYNFDLY